MIDIICILHIVNIIYALWIEKSYSLYDLMRRVIMKTIWFFYHIYSFAGLQLIMVNTLTVLSIIGYVIKIRVYS